MLPRHLYTPAPQVVLPEGASNPVATTELPLSAGPTLETKHTYLDVMGRPVVVLRARNLVSDMTTPVKASWAGRPWSGIAAWGGRDGPRAMPLRARRAQPADIQRT